MWGKGGGRCKAQCMLSVKLWDHKAQRMLSVKLHRSATELGVPPEQKTQEPGAQPKLCLEVIEVEITKVLSSVTP